MTLPVAFQTQFPKLAVRGYKFTSPATPLYNCIAWAANDTSRWWWPTPTSIGYWPEGAPREVTMVAFIAAYATLGFELCENAEVEPGFEKVALFAGINGEPTHAARQLEDGSWTSKLGRHIDLSHTIDGLDGPTYGCAIKFLRRSKQDSELGKP